MKSNVSMQPWQNPRTPPPHSFTLADGEKDAIPVLWYNMKAENISLFL